MVEIADLKKLSHDAKRLMVQMLNRAKCGHPGGALSSLDTLVALYFSVMRVDPKNPADENRDYFLLSKGHSSVGLYAVLHLRGFFDRATVLSFRQDGSALCGHPVLGKVPGVEMSTGSLGQGLGVACGLAYALKHDRKENRVFCLVGDGESQEGSVWEAAMFAAHRKLDNLTVIVDRNGLQIDGSTEVVMALEPFADKWLAFGFDVECVDGHDYASLIPALDKRVVGKPRLVLAQTVKGKGISFMENNRAWHGGGLSDELALKATAELDRWERDER
jgi:transketolase